MSTITKLLSFLNYKNYKTEANPTKMQDLQAYLQNQNDCLQAVVDSYLWQPDTPLALAAIVHSPSMGAGLVAIVTAAGVTGSAEPTWGAAEASVTDGSVTYTMRSAGGLYDTVDAQGAKLATVAQGAQVNTIETVQVDGTALAVSNKAVNVDLSGKADKATTLAGYGITDAYNKDEVDAKLVTVYKAGGQCTFAALPALSATYMGYVFDVSDAFTTTDSFLEGAGKAYPAHTNVAIVVRGGTYYYDANTGLLDGYATLASPALTGTPTAPTAAQNDNSTKLATTAYVDAAVSCRNWQPGKAYVVGRVIESNTLPPGCIAQCTTAGTSGTTEPTWGSTSGVTVTDGTCVWTLMMMKFRYDEGTGFSVDKYYSPKDGVMKNEIHEWVFYSGTPVTGISINYPLVLPGTAKYFTIVPFSSSNFCIIDSKVTSIIINFSVANKYFWLGVFY